MLRVLLETFGVLLLIGFGVLAGLWSARWKSPWWAVGYAVSMPIILMIALVRQQAWLAFVDGFAFFTYGRNEYVFMSLAIPLSLATLIGRTEQRRMKILLALLIAAGSLNFSIAPFLAPAFVYRKLASLETTFIGDVCIQSTGYTCGPACAVTALKMLGIDADEGRIAIAAHTTTITGTPDDILAKTIERLYGDQGVTCTCRYYDSIEQLKGKCPVIATIKFGALVDHYITIMEITPDYIMAGDPLAGKTRLTYEEFKDKWRNVGVEVKCASADPLRKQ